MKTFFTAIYYLALLGFLIYAVIGVASLFPAATVIIVIIALVLAIIGKFSKNIGDDVNTEVQQAEEGK